MPHHRHRAEEGPVARRGAIACGSGVAASAEVALPSVRASPLAVLVAPEVGSKGEASSSSTTTCLEGAQPNLQSWRFRYTEEVIKQLDRRGLAIGGRHHGYLRTRMVLWRARFCIHMDGGRSVSKPQPIGFGLSSSVSRFQFYARSNKSLVIPPRATIPRPRRIGPPVYRGWEYPHSGRRGLAWC